MGSEVPSNAGIVTGDPVSDLTADGQAVERALGARGYGVNGVVWSDSDVDYAIEGMPSRHENAGERRERSSSVRQGREPPSIASSHE